MVKLIQINQKFLIKIKIYLIYTVVADSGVKNNMTCVIEVKYNNQDEIHIQTAFTFITKVTIRPRSIKFTSLCPD